jgi:hypothetical protein
MRLRWAEGDRIGMSGGLEAPYVRVCLALRGGSDETTRIVAIVKNTKSGLGA